MTCKRCQEQLPEYVGGSVEERASGAVAAHLETCADCREAHAEWMLLRTTLESSVATRTIVPPRYLAPPRSPEPPLSLAQPRSLEPERRAAPAGSGLPESPLARRSAVMEIVRASRGQATAPSEPSREPSATATPMSAPTRRAPTEPPETSVPAATAPSVPPSEPSATAPKPEPTHTAIATGIVAGRIVGPDGRARAEIWVVAEQAVGPAEEVRAFTDC